ncbi:MAG: hypothetical protein LBF74_13780 [Treponema sp.]|jgi:uncharacterized protein with gpF-like domain|nr:hypothetical protein [Treponema sp.]
MPETGNDRFPQPKIAMEFLSKKINLDTDRWDDLKWGEHAHAFTVAHSVEADVVDRIHGLLNKALADGEAFDTFRKNMIDMMKAEGWYGGAGHTADEKQYINWRIRMIYDTNMKTAYAAEHYHKQLEIADMRPVWVYQSKLVGDNRRQDHVALHDKAFRSDDPFWDTYYPPNGWGCDCSVITKSVSGAERDGIEVLHSDDKGNPPPMQDKDGNPVDWKTFADGTWKYNVGREALAPNFRKYTNVPDDALKQMYKAFSKSMDNTRLTQGEFKTLVRRTNEKDYLKMGINYQVGNLEEKRFDALKKHNVFDSKIMSTDERLWHGTGDKNNEQKIPERLFDDVYETLQTPESIYEEDVSALKNNYRVFHFIKDTKDGKKIKVVLYQRNLKNSATALQLRSMGYSTYEYVDGKHKKIW